ncbi:NADP-dependent 3-hydroxy acid dehydrogenase YdfG [Chitinophaga sp. CF118]|uniref:SDR family oxidoreductase n=1 Tax=Chitinophaga sp. CF118 TaxID=1884367 RepID=UPI0008E4B85D|nr:SDR family oxidoreductase [Chitinophaga sp. CF118]SFD82974.1 NADP-dependent 3-hydroxy acid dehydrogenase YdfG [Chitinophaga sp. CF118]
MSKIVLITGASTGLGAAIATYLSAKGHIAYGVSRNIQQEGQPFRTLKMDVGDESSIKQAVQTIIKEHGRIDVVINNAGLGLIGPVEYLSIPDVMKIIDTNVLGVLRTTQAVLPFMRQQKSGLIINISSIAAENGLPYRAIYSASKAGVDRMTEALRVELAPFGVQACYVQPGGVYTNINNNRINTVLPAGSEYKESWDRCFNIIQDSVSKGLSTDAFGPLIEKIINTPRVKRCYRIGKPIEKLSVFLKKLLPAHVFEKMISNHYQIR